MNFPETKTSRNRALIFNILKVLFAGGLLFWLVKSGGIRPEYLMVEAAEIPTLIAACLLIIVGMLLFAPRYVMLLKGAGLTISMWDSVKISAILNFFTQCVLGSASGDVARYFYTTRITGQGTKVGAAIILDRIIGVMGLFLLGGLGMALNWPLVEHSPELRHLATPLLAVFALLWLGVVLGFLTLIRGRRFGFMAGLPVVILTGMFWAVGSGFFSGEVCPVLFGASSFSLCAPLLAPEFMEDGFIFKKFFKGSKLGVKIGEVFSAMLIYRNSASSVLKVVVLTMIQHLDYGLFPLPVFSDSEYPAIA
ncbi:lysylphosphatidylglycerol synthase domain-containing protein [Maridesulfovibrio sp.]|uniref:lysylphosphatidylglycerol synthase domain-containing protein n=1 Tax=Maridesulfovibrio sp. TaxID=2795000 RepID=UPI0039EE2E7D